MGHLMEPKAEYTKEHQRRLRHLLSDRIGLCGCGTGDTWPLLLSMLERAENHTSRGYFTDPLGDIPANAIEFIAHVMDSWELLEHGSGIGSAWLTQDGIEVLTFLRRWGTDPGEMGNSIWPEWWCSCLDTEKW